MNEFIHTKMKSTFIEEYMGEGKPRWLGFVHCRSASAPVQMTNTMNVRITLRYKDEQIEV